MAKRVSIGDGVYKDEAGSFYVRPSIDGKRTWRKLDAVKQRYAIEEARAKFTDHSRAKQGIVKSPFAPADGMFQALSDAYVAAGCPNKKLEPRAVAFATNEKLRLVPLNAFFGKRIAAMIRIPMLTEYAAWRKPQFKKRGCTGERTIDMEFVTLSNVLHYGVAIGEVEFNRVAVGRPRYRKAEDIQRSKERAIKSGDDLHRLAEYFFDSWKSEVMGWLVIFSALTGCRNEELRALRLDGTSAETPGWISGNQLFLRRAKRGIHPWKEIKDELADALECFRYWHEMRFPAGTRHFTPWWFPGQSRGQMQKDSFRHAVYRACSDLELPRVSPHGFRSFYVTKRRSEGAPDVQIAIEIGDKTVAVISESYGDVPPNWVGQEKLSFMPKEGLPAWARWKAQETKIITL